MADPAFIEARRDDFGGLGPDPRPRGPHRRGRPTSGRACAARFTPPPSPPRWPIAASWWRPASTKEVEIIEVPLSGRFTVGPFEIRADHADPFHPGAQCAGDPHRGGIGAAHRRLEAGPGAAGRRGLRRERAPRARRGGPARHGLRFHQRPGARASPARKAEVRAALMELVGGLKKPGSAVCLLRLQRRAPGHHRQGRGREWPPGRARRPLHGPGDPGGDATAATCRTSRRSSPRRIISLSCRPRRCWCCAPAVRARRARRHVAHRQRREPRYLARPGDAVIFSSRVIPGNETSIHAGSTISLVRLEVEIITDRRPLRSTSPAIRRARS